MPSLHKLWYCCIVLLDVLHTQTWQSEQWITEVYISSPIHHNVDIELAENRNLVGRIPQEKHQRTTTKLHPVKVLQAVVWMLAGPEQRSCKVWMNLGRKKAFPQICKQTHWEKSHRNKLHDLLTGTKHFNTRTFLNLGHEMSHEVLSGHCDAWDETWNLWLGNQRDDPSSD